MRFARTVEEILLEQREAQLATAGRRLAASREREGGQARAVVESAAATRRRIKAERRERIAELRRQGETARVIARRLGLSERQVYDLSSAFQAQP